MAIARVCAAVPMDARRAGLSFDHHRAVAKLEPKEQATWLARAETKGWDRDELRLALSPQIEGPHNMVRAPYSGNVVCPKCGHVITVTDGQRSNSYGASGHKTYSLRSAGRRLKRPAAPSQPNPRRNP